MCIRDSIETVIYKCYLSKCQCIAMSLYIETMHEKVFEKFVVVNYVMVQNLILVTNANGDYYEY